MVWLARLGAFVTHCAERVRGVESEGAGVGDELDLRARSRTSCDASSAAKGTADERDGCHMELASCIA